MISTFSRSKMPLQYQQEAKVKIDKSIFGCDSFFFR